MKEILYCENCKLFTMKNVCPKCGQKTTNPLPPKYSPEDKYAKYRRIAKFGLIKKQK